MTRITGCPGCGGKLRTQTRAEGTALVCRKCGLELLMPSSPRGGRAGASKRVNPFAVGGLLLALLAWPATLVGFLAIYRSLLPSMRLGIAMAAAGLTLGVLGVFLWAMRRPRVGGLAMSLTAVAIALFAGVSFLAYDLVAREMLEALPASSPLTPVIRQLLQGPAKGEEGAGLPMKCQDCGRGFRADPLAVLVGQMEMLGAIYGGAGDIEKALDQAEKAGRKGGVECPACASRRTAPALAADADLSGTQTPEREQRRQLQER